LIGFVVNCKKSSLFSQLSGEADFSQYSIGDLFPENPKLVDNPDEIVITLPNQISINAVAQKIFEYAEWVQWHRTLGKNELANRIPAIEKLLGLRGKNNQQLICGTGD
jgi:hypothetical protein